MPVRFVALELKYGHQLRTEVSTSGASAAHGRRSGNWRVTDSAGRIASPGVHELDKDRQAVQSTQRVALRQNIGARLPVRRVDVHPDGTEAGIGSGAVALKVGD